MVMMIKTKKTPTINTRWHQDKDRATTYFTLSNSIATASRLATVNELLTVPLFIKLR